MKKRKKEKKSWALEFVLDPFSILKFHFAINLGPSFAFVLETRAEPELRLTREQLGCLTGPVTLGPNFASQNLDLILISIKFDLMLIISHKIKLE